MNSVDRVCGARNSRRDSWFVHRFEARENNAVIHHDLRERNGWLGMSCHRWDDVIVTLHDDVFLGKPKHHKAKLSS